MKNWFLFVVVVLVQGKLIAQQGTVTGVVYDENGETMAGVNVYVDGIQTAKSTDIDGRFLIELQPGTYTFTFKFVSYKSLSIAEIKVISDKLTDVMANIVPQDDSVLTVFNTGAKLDYSGDPSLEFSEKTSSTNITNAIANPIQQKSSLSNTTTSQVILNNSSANTSGTKYDVMSRIYYVQTMLSKRLGFGGI